MARIPAASIEDLGADEARAFEATRDGLASLTGRAPDRMIEPLEMMAHLPGLLRAVGGLAYATAELDLLDKRIVALAELKAATLTHCEYCIDLGSQVSRQWGLSDDELLALASYRSSDLFTDVEKLVLDYAVGMSRTPVDVPDALFAKLREHFSVPQIVELTHVIALENLYGRFNLALGIGAAGFSDGMVCALPASA